MRFECALARPVWTQVITAPTLLAGLLARLGQTLRNSRVRN
jgi:hypothetical protein